jgi:hypothetical protein
MALGSPIYYDKEAWVDLFYNTKGVSTVRSIMRDHDKKNPYRSKSLRNRRV